MRRIPKFEAPVMVAYSADGETRNMARELPKGIEGSITAIVDYLPRRRKLFAKAIPAIE